MAAVHQLPAADLALRNSRVGAPLAIRAVRARVVKPVKLAQADRRRVVPMAATAARRREASSKAIGAIPITGAIQVAVEGAEGGNGTIAAVGASARSVAGEWASGPVEVRGAGSSRAGKAGAAATSHRRAAGISG